MNPIALAFLTAVATKAGEYVVWHVSDAVTKRRKRARREARARWRTAGERVDAALGNAREGGH